MALTSLANLGGLCALLALTVFTPSLAAAAMMSATRWAVPGGR